MTKKDPCKRFSCRIQDCLRANDYQESACQAALEDMRQCCVKWGLDSYVCGGINTTVTPLKTESKKQQGAHEI